MIQCIFGKTKTGKTWYLQEKIVRPSVLPCIIVDTVKEYKKYAIESKITDDVSFDNFKIRFCPITEIDFDIVCRCVSQQKFRYGVNFIIDELDQFVGSHKLPYYFRKVLYQSEHYKINMFMSVHSPVDMNTKVRNLAHKFIIFKTTEENYLQYFAKKDPSLYKKLPKLRIKQFETLDL